MRPPTNVCPSDWIGSSPAANYAYWIACTCVIALATGLHLHELSANSLWLDEALVAYVTEGTFSETLQRVREDHSAPLLYTLVLWLVQKVESSEIPAAPQSVKVGNALATGRAAPTP